MATERIAGVNFINEEAAMQTSTYARGRLETFISAQKDEWDTRVSL